MNVNNNNTQNQYYFAYGSNLLRDRIALSIPHVEFKCAGFLKVKIMNLKFFNQNLLKIFFRIIN